MEAGEGLTSAATVALSIPVGSTTTRSPPLREDRGPDPALNPDEVVEPEFLAPLSDEDAQINDHEHEHEDDHDQDHDHAADQTGVSMDDLKLKIIKQVEYYFSDENLPTDKYLLSFIKKNKEGFVPVSVIASFRKMKKLTRDHSFIVAALRESSLLVVSGDGKRVKGLNPSRFDGVRDSKNLPADHSKENIQRIFSEAGNIKRISIHDPRAIAESAKHVKQEMMISNKSFLLFFLWLHALVEYETIEAAERAVATLNDEEDWRNGLRVKFLKRMGKYGHRKQAWKGSDTEKNNTGRTPEQTEDDENHSANEHYEDTQEDEEGEHLTKDKSGHRCRNRGRPRKHKYRGINGMGHGSPSAGHPVEASKPPPGPRMPDGTRGFTMGRGRPPVAYPI